MGCYDSFVAIPPIECPFCGKPVLREFQTKDFNCELCAFKIGDKVKFYNTVAEDGEYIVYESCKYCGAWVEAQVVIEDSIFIRFEQVGKFKSHKSECIERIEDDGDNRIFIFKGGGKSIGQSLKFLDKQED